MNISCEFKYSLSQPFLIQITFHAYVTIQDPCLWFASLLSLQPPPPSTCTQTHTHRHTHTHTHTHELHNSKYIAWIVHYIYSDLRSLRLPKIWKNALIQSYILSSKTWLKFSELYPLGISLKVIIWLTFAEFQTKFSIIIII